MHNHGCNYVADRALHRQTFHRDTAVSLGVLLLLIGCWSLWQSPAQANTKASRFVKADCSDFISQRPSGVSCGFYSFPLKHDEKPDARDKESVGTAVVDSVLIPVMIARSTNGQSSTQKSAVLIPGGGGPGSGMGFGYFYEPGEFLEPYESLRQSGIDVVIVDQRGAGLSRPRLTCGESLVAFRSMIGQKRTIEQELSGYQTAITECRNRLRREHVDIQHFDTKQSALDFLAIMRELDYSKWFTIATSYATTIAQAMQSLQPNAFDRIVLDSPVPLHYQHPITWERTQSAIAESINRCTAERNCAHRYPDLSKKLDDILTSAASEPFLIKISVYDESDIATAKTVVADNTTVLSILGTAVYYNEHISELPRVITDLHNGLTQALNGFTETFWYQATDDTYADGLNMTVHCKERQTLEDQYVASRPGFYNTLSHASRLLMVSQKKLCAVWGVGEEPTAIPTLQTDTSTLILAGGLDPVISVEDIENTASYFSNVSVETMAGAGHSVWYQHACARERVIDFLTSEQDTSTESSAVDCDAVIPGFK